MDMEIPLLSDPLVRHPVKSPRVPIPCERTFGISRPFLRQMRHYDPASAAFSCLGGRKCA